MKGTVLLSLLVGFILCVKGDPPVLTGYSNAVRASNYFITPGYAPYVYLYTDTAPGIARVGLVYAAMDTFTIPQVWVGVGWSTSCQMLLDGQPSDAVVVWVDNNNQTHLSDFYLYARNEPSAAGCLGNNDSICADTSKPAAFSCTNNAQIVSSNVTDDGYVVVEFTRPLVASDMCDIPVQTGVPVCMLVATGDFQASAEVWPNNLKKHTFHTEDPTKFNITWPIPAGTSAGSSSSSSTTASTSSTTAAIATTGTTGVASTTGPSSTTAVYSTTATSSSSTTGVVSTTGPVDCNNLATKCQDECGSLKVKLCRCINNQPSVQCSSESTGSLNAFFSIAIICLAVMFTVL